MNTITRENQLARRRFLAGGLAVGAAALLSSSLHGMAHAAALSSPSATKTGSSPTPCRNAVSAPCRSLPSASAVCPW